MRTGGLGAGEVRLGSPATGVEILQTPPEVLCGSSVVRFGRVSLSRCWDSDRATARTLLTQDRVFRSYQSNSDRLQGTAFGGCTPIGTPASFLPRCDGGSPGPRSPEEPGARSSPPAAGPGTGEGVRRLVRPETTDRSYRLSRPTTGAPPRPERGVPGSTEPFFSVVGPLLLLSSS